MKTIPAHRTHLTMPEVMARWEWNENDLREAFIHGRLVPSCFLKTPLWLVTQAPHSKSSLPAVIKNTWMYLVNFKQTGAHDGYFHNVSDSYDAANTGKDLFKIDGNDYTKDHLIRLTVAMSEGVVMMDEILRFEASTKLESDERKTDPKQRWWVEKFDIVAMATQIELDAKKQNWGLIQRGARAGKYPISSIAAMIATSIANKEKAANRSRTIGEKSIANYLKEQGWQ